MRLYFVVSLSNIFEALFNCEIFRILAHYIYVYFFAFYIQKISKDADNGRVVYIGKQPYIKIYMYKKIYTYIYLHKKIYTYKYIYKNT